MNIHQTHELRHHDYTKGVNHSEVLYYGTKDECMANLSEIAKPRNVGVSYLLGNAGYSIVSLEEERINKIKAAAPELLEALKEAKFAIMNYISNTFKPTQEKECIEYLEKDRVYQQILNAIKKTE